VSTPTPTASEGCTLKWVCRPSTGGDLLSASPAAKLQKHAGLGTPTASPRPWSCRTCQRVRATLLHVSSRFPDLSISRFLDVSISRFPDFSISQFPDILISRFPDFSISLISRFPDFSIPRFIDFLISRFLYFLISRFSDFPHRRPLDAQTLLSLEGSGGRGAALRIRHLASASKRARQVTNSSPNLRYNLWYPSGDFILYRAYIEQLRKMT
jgi:hypothetical protein